MSARGYALLSVCPNFFPLVPFPGIPLVLAAGSGMALGGYLVRRLKLNCARTVKFCVSVTLVGFIPLVGFTYHCPRGHIAGVTSPYDGRDGQT